MITIQITVATTVATVAAVAASTKTANVAVHFYHIDAHVLALLLVHTYMYIFNIHPIERRVLGVCAVCMKRKAFGFDAKVNRRTGTAAEKERVSGAGKQMSRGEREGEQEKANKRIGDDRNKILQENSSTFRNRQHSLTKRHVERTLPLSSQDTKKEKNQTNATKRIEFKVLFVEHKKNSDFDTHSHLRYE